MFALPDDKFLRQYEDTLTYEKQCLIQLCERGCIQKFPDWVDNEIYAYNNKHSLRNNPKDYGGKTHYTGSQNSDTTAPSGKKLYY
jgi:hypothetical protein